MVRSVKMTQRDSETATHRGAERSRGERRRGRTCGVDDTTCRDERAVRPTIAWVGVVVCLVLIWGCDGQLELRGDTESFPATSEQSTTNGSTNGGEPGESSPQARASLHRLNKLEYNNSVGDLLGTTLTPADDFPPDASVGGFDNVSSALSITPALMDRYVEAARDVVEDAFADRPEFEAWLEEDDPRLSYTIDRDQNRIGGIVRLRNGSAQASVDVLTAGSHTVVVRAQGVVNGGAAAPRMRVAVDGQNFDFDVPMAMQETSFPLDLQPGSHTVALQPLNFEENAAENRGNDILFDYVVLRSDALVEGPARERVMVCEPVEPNVETCASTIIHGFARRAWRRPLTDAEKTKLDDLFATVRAAGEGVEESIKLTLRAILTSPKFLYRYRTIEDADTEELLDPHVLASRLSYFIWSSTPDERLLTAAEDGTLSTADGIRQTVSWMLEDPRSSALAEGFAEQWLDLRHLEQASPSEEVYPEFDESVRRSMIRESKLFFLDFVGNEQPVSAMLQPDFAYRDGTLAAHLGVEGPSGDGFERVDVTDGDRRGILALSAWLTSRSDSEHSSPIRRGSWVADNMLCRPVPPPPAGLEIGELMEAEGDLTVRESLELHRNDPACSGCHSYLDVLGMGFETYDGVGRYIDDPMLDSRGELPSGDEFRGADGMAAAMDQSTFVTCVSKKLFAYALGRSVEPSDLENVPELEEPSVVTLTLPDLVTAIVLSPAFSRPSPLE
jgi:hypothetical protein